MTIRSLAPAVALLIALAPVAARAQDTLEVAGRRTFEVCPVQAVGIRGTGQVDGVDILVRGQPRCDLGGASGDQVDDACGHVGGRQDLGERHCGQRPLLAGQDHGGVAGDHGRCQHGDQAQQ